MIFRFSFAQSTRLLYDVVIMCGMFINVCDVSLKTTLKKKKKIALDIYSNFKRTEGEGRLLSRGRKSWVTTLCGCLRYDLIRLERRAHVKRIYIHIFFFTTMFFAVTNAAGTSLT